MTADRIAIILVIIIIIIIIIIINERERRLPDHGVCPRGLEGVRGHEVVDGIEP
jgi:hypothetical protein